MKQETLEVLAAMGDKSTRDTAHLLDLAIAGSIDHLKGHGTVRLMPARLEELANRIDKRHRDPDGAWVVTLRPPEDDLVGVNAYDVLAYIHETTPGVEDKFTAIEIASLVQAAAVPGVTLRDLGMQGFAYFVEWVGERYA